ncbi:FAD-dependent oxidoreductase [Litorisediminicola beolgyonensis]|uniref:FAD-dependent oxidoreductase n=1 Tax=Litorisediminicola beolgyonensis TaxID=1173614 RepID=A0ABW3ZLU3_9RHOB
MSLTRRALLFGSGAAIGAVAAMVEAQKLPSLGGTVSLAPEGGEGVLNDASKLSETPVFKHITVTRDPGERLVEAIRAEMDEAREEGRPVALSAARHSMGGHALPENGHAVTLENATVEVDTDARTALVHAGARWSEVIPALDRWGFGPKVMQSNNDFGVASTFAVNAHGWPVPYGPMGSTVRSVFLVEPGGELLEISRDKEPELFAMTMGGYGLTGAIVSLVIEIEPDRRLVPFFETMPAEEFGPAFVAAVSGEESRANMGYGRLNVARGAFFDEALMVTYLPTEDQSDLPPVGTSNWMSHASRYIFRGQLGREAVKTARWSFETDIAPLVAGGTTTRNTLLNEPVETLRGFDPSRTDILHEYFVPPDRWEEFVTACREVIPSSYQSLLNVTLRYVAADTESVLSYAPEPRIAAVMLFSQEMTERAETDMRRMTSSLIDRVIDLGGTYYLPYRPHATRRQLRQGYPNAREFAQRKREIDPDLLFRNMFWDRYFA